MEEEHQINNLAQMAVFELEINVPIISAERRGRVLRLRLYNREQPVEWDIPDSVKLPGDEMASGEKSKKKRGKQ